MRLTKTLYLVEQQTTDQVIGTDSFDRPVYQIDEVKTPLSAEVEPYSSKLAQTNYGVNIDVSFRLFTQPNDSIQLNKDVLYNDDEYYISGVMKYDRHWEVMITEGTAE